MFLDEELEKIYLKHKDDEVEYSELLFKAMWNRLKEKVNSNPNVSMEEFLVYLKQIDNSWRLFAKKYDHINQEAWRLWVKYRDTTEGEVIKALGW